MSLTKFAEKLISEFKVVGTVDLESIPRTSWVKWDPSMRISWTMQSDDKEGEDGEKRGMVEFWINILNIWALARRTRGRCRSREGWEEVWEGWGG
jgi:hypothetical protein